MDNIAPNKCESNCHWERATAMLFSILMIGAVLWPITMNWRDEPRDSFPLSYYPMFTKKRPEQIQITHLVGFDQHGNPCRIHYKSAGTGGLNQVRKQIRKIVDDGEADQLCRSVASRVLRKHRGLDSTPQWVAIVTSTYQLDDYFTGGQRPESSQVIAMCRVGREK